MRNHAKQPKQTSRPGHWAAMAGLALLGLAIWFGLHPHYRPLAAVPGALLLLSLLKRAWAPWLLMGALVAFGGFLWTFGPAGYHFASLPPLFIALLVPVFCLAGRRIRRAAALLSSLLVLVILAAEAPILTAAAQASASDAPYVIVLGAAVYGQTPSISLRHRTERAIRHLKANPDAKAVVSGGQGPGEDISEAACMKRYMEAHGVDPARILTEDRSTSTSENLAYSKAVIEADHGSGEHVAIVSSAYHLYRAKAMAKELGMAADGLSSQDGYPVYMAGMYLREALAVWKMWIFGTN